MDKASRYYLSAFVVSALGAAITYWAFPRLPETIVSHWGLNWNPNGHSNKDILLWLSALPFALLLLFYYLPKLDPLQKMPENAARNTAKYAQLGLMMATFIGGINALVVAYNLALDINMPTVFSLLFAGLFFALGRVLRDVKPNWFLGIRTPWTLSSEEVWQKTHRVTGKLFEATGICMAAVALFVPQMAVIVMLALAVGCSIAAVIYSYILWRKEQDEGRRRGKAKPKAKARRGR